MYVRILDLYTRVKYYMSASSLPFINALLQEKHFINDTIRSEFHRKFMDKYVK